MATTASSTSRPRGPQRPHGERSRERILTAAREIAAERGYDGTSMAAVSRRCGLPTSSIYWHFVDKDDLMSHVIRDSFRTWNAIWDLPEEIDVLSEMPLIFDDVRRAIQDSPVFLRLGLQLAMQQRTDDPKARRLYLGIRKDARARLTAIADTHFPMIDPVARQSTVAFILASIDGLFIARELDEDVDVDQQIETLLRAVVLLVRDDLATSDTTTAANSTSGDTMPGPTDDQLTGLADTLYTARENATDVLPPTETHPGLTVEQAYRVQSLTKERDLGAGQRIVGHKIGLTSLAMQEQLGVDEPDYGYITDRMVIADSGSAPRDRFVAPRVEPEIAFRLARDLDATGDDGAPVTAADVLAATDAVAVSLEVVDSRVEDWRITLADTIADNASSAAVVLGPWVPLASAGPLPELHGELVLDGEVVGTGDRAAVLGDPAEAVAWLVNAYGRLGQTVQAGEFVMSGSMCAAAWAQEGSHAEARISGLGSVSMTFSRDGGDSGVRPGSSEDVRPAVNAVAAVSSVLRPGDIRHVEVVVVRPGGLPGATAEEEAATAAADPDAEIGALSAALEDALESVGAGRAKVIMLINPAVPPVAPGATVTCLVDGQVDDVVLGAVSDAVTAAVGARLGGPVTTSPVGARSALSPVRPEAVSLSMTLDLSGGPGEEALGDRDLRQRRHPA